MFIFTYILYIVGVFKKKRGSGTWGHGLDILKELVELIESSGLINEVERVYISLLGSESDRSEAKIALKGQEKVQIVIESPSSDLVEFPALYALQTYSNMSHPSTKILYMHTTGVRKNGWHPDYPIQWRKYMSFFLVDKYSVCFTALDKMRYSTCGVLKQQSIYQGNFWWTTAGM